MLRSFKSGVWVLALTASFAVSQAALAQQSQSPAQTSQSGASAQQTGQGQQDLQKAERLTKESKELSEEAKKKAEEAKRLAEGDQDPSQRTVTGPAQRTVTDPSQRQAREQQAQQRTVSESKVHKASDVIGLTVKTRGENGESIGDIDDLALDRQSGEIRYAALSVGGVLGIGDKLYAVPWDSLQFQKSDDELVVTSSLTKNQLEQGQELPDENWPEQPQMVRGAQQQQQAQRGPRQQDQTVQTQRQPGQQGILRASHVMDADVRGRAQDEDEIGSIDDLAINLQQGRVPYVALQMGGLLDAQERKLVAVPWEAIRFHDQQDDDAPLALLAIDQRQLQEAPALADDNWPAMAQIRVTARPVDQQDTQPRQDTRQYQQQQQHTPQTRSGDGTMRDQPESQPGSPPPFGAQGERKGNGQRGQQQQQQGQQPQGGAPQ